MTKKAVILLSGGLDSTTCLALAKSKGFDCYALSFDYGQRHALEIQAAKRIAQFFQVKKHHIMRLSLDDFGDSALTDKDIQVPDFCGSKEIPVTYVPARNTIFLSMALAWAEVLSAWDIFIGVSYVDYSGYPDCRPEYIKAFQEMANLATKTSVEGNKVQIHSPLIYLSKAQTITLGLSLGVDYSMTVTCYQANSEGRPCRKCDSCYLREKGFAETGIKDPALI